MPTDKPEITFEEALVLVEQAQNVNFDSIRAAHAREVAQKVAAAVADNADHDWRRQMEAYGFDSVEKVLSMVAAARAEGCWAKHDDCPACGRAPLLARADEQEFHAPKNEIERQGRIKWLRAAACEKEGR